MDAFFLSKHVHVCHARGAAVFLDIRAARYLAINEASSYALSPLVTGWSTLIGERSSQTDNEDGLALAEQMAARGLLTRDACDGKTACKPCVQVPSGVLVQEDPRQVTESRFSEFARFVRASVKAAAELKLLSFERVIRAIELRKSNGALPEPNPEALRDAVTTFENLKLYAFTSRDACLFHSLALTEFLWSLGMRSDWIFGVRLHPFAAHCWVQWKHFVLNDVPERVRAYEPILKI